MKTRILLVTAAFVAFGGIASAQAVSWSLGWDQPGMALVDVQGAVYTLSVDAAAPVVITPTCTQPNVTLVTCSAPIGALASGSHTLVLTMQSGGGTASATLVTTPPSTPLNPRIVIKIAVP